MTARIYFNICNRASVWESMTFRTSDHNRKDPENVLGVTTVAVATTTARSVKYCSEIIVNFTLGLFLNNEF